MMSRVKRAAFIATFCTKVTSLQAMRPNTHLPMINKSITKTGMQNKVMRMFAKLRLNIEKLVELLRSRLWRNIAENKTQFPTRDTKKIIVKKKIMITLSPNVNWHFTKKQLGTVSLESVPFILPIVTKSPSHHYIWILVQIEKVLVFVNEPSKTSALEANRRRKNASNKLQRFQSFHLLINVFSSSYL